MMGRLLFIICTLALAVICTEASGQSVDYDYYPYAETETGSVPEMNPEPFYRPAHSKNSMAHMLRYMPHPVRFRAQGLSQKDDIVIIDGLRLDAAATHTTHGQILSALYAGFAARRDDIHSSDGITAPAGATTIYTASVPQNRYGDSRISLGLTDRSYRISLRGQTHIASRSGKWETALSARLRYGPDAHVKGVFTSSAGYAVSVTRHWNSEARLTLFSTAEASRQGMRAAAVGMTHRLTGDNLYNPLWGYSDGKVLNSRIRSGFMPLNILSAVIPLKNGHTLSAAIGLVCGQADVSSLACFDAVSPMPDHYRKLPSASGREDTEQTVAQQWQSGNPRYTQIDWDELRFQNRYATGHGHYIIEKRIEHPVSLHARIGDTRTSGRMSISYGIEAAAGTIRRFKRAGDMLGSSYVLNIDQYRTEDFNFGAHIRNDIRQKDILVHRHDRFGYDYSIVQSRAGAYCRTEYRSRRISAAAGARLQAERILRNGRYENPMFRGGESYGKSAPVNNVSYAFDIDVKGVFGPAHTVYIHLGTSAGPADFDDIFLNPERSSRTFVPTQRRSIHTLRAGYVFNLAGLFEARIDLFAQGTQGSRRILRYYDDLSDTFCDAVIRYGTLLHTGADITVQADITRSLSLSAALRYGYSGYTGDAAADIFADADAAPVASRTACRIRGIRAGNHPDAVAAAQLSFRRRGWYAELSACYYGLRFADTNPLYFTSRVSGLAAAPETAAMFTKQTRLPDACTVNLSVMKTFFMNKAGYITAGAAVNNLLCDRDIIYAAYPQMRILKTGSGMNRSFAPSPLKYLYAYPLTARLTVSYTF